MKTKLNIHQLELPVFLGWLEEERLTEQTIFIDFEILFSKPLKACVSDQLEDTYCYQTFSDFLYESISQKKYQLIERLTQEIYELSHHFFGNEPSIKVSVIKKPKLSFHHAGVSFTFGDH